MNRLLGLLQPGWVDLFEILIVAFLLYRLLILIQRTRAMQMLLGAFFLVGVYFLARLLDLVDRFGTLTHAAREARMSYRYAWNLIKEAEAHLGTSMILTQPGGTGGGHSALSAEGRRLLDTFKRLSSEVATFADQRFKTMFFHETASDLKDTP